MRKVRYVWKGTNIDNNGLSIDKVYDVIEHNKFDETRCNTITILNDYQKKVVYHLRWYDNIYFIDIMEYRDEIIDGILI